MTMRLDVMTHDAGDLVRREHARDLAAGVVVAVYRLARLAQMHDLGNQAFVRQLEDLHALLHDYCLRSGCDLNVLFARRAVFVAGQLLKGSRATYESAAELAAILEHCGGSELTIAKDVTPAELHAFAEAISAAMRVEKGKGWRPPSPRVRLRAVTDAARLRGLELEPMPLEQRIVRTYASAVVVMRRFFDDLRAGRYVLPRRVKRIAQMLVDLSAGSTPAFLGVAEARNANHDDAGRAVNTAVLAVAVARQIAEDRAALSQIAMAAVMLDAGRPRAAALQAQSGPQISGVVPRLTDEAEEKLPAGTAAVLTTLGRVNEPTVTRTVIAYEALSLGRAARVGPVYGGVRGPTLQARIVAVARRYNDLLTPEPGLPPKPPDFAVATLSEELKDPADRTVLRMLVSALGLFPVGTVVQLSTHEVGEVIGGGDRAASLGRPRLRLVMDAQGAVLSSVVEVDLARPGANDPPRAISKVLSVDGWKKGLGETVRVDTPPPPSSSRVPPERESGVSLGTSPSSVANAVERFMSPPVTPTGASQVKPKPPALDEAGRGKVQFSIPAGARKAAQDPLRELAPTARGMLSATPLPHVLVYMLDHALSGTVTFREPDGGESLVYFLEGSPAKVRTHKPVAVLGDELVAMGAIRKEMVDKALEGAKRLGVLLGEYLVGNGMLTEGTLHKALAAQLEKKVASMANLPGETVYTFFRDVNALDAWGGPRLSPCHPLDGILACVREWFDRARIHATLARMDTQSLVLHPEVDLAPLKLTEDEESVLAVIRAEAPTLRDLVQRKVADEENIGTLVYMLAVTRQFAFPGAKGLPMARKVAAAPAAAQEEERISTLPFSAVVEPPRRPGAEAKAPESASPKTWRPPTGAKAPTSDVPVEVDDEAWGDATDPNANAAAAAAASASASASAGAGAGAGPGARVSDDVAERAIQAMTDFRLAETALQRGDPATAEQLAARAAAGDPTQADYPALLAWVRALSGKPTAVSDAVAALTQVVARYPKSERALVYRGQLHKRAGRSKEALRDFERVLELNPNHREAASEARVLRTRINIKK
jgi:hypothetical protein